MTNNKWMILAGMLESCVYNKEHPGCPFEKYRKLDLFQRMEILFSIDENEASRLLDLCQCKHHDSFIKFEQEKRREKTTVHSI